MGADMGGAWVDPVVGELYVLACFEWVDGVRGTNTYQAFVIWDPTEPWGARDVGVRAAEVARGALVAPVPVVGGSPVLDRPLLVGVRTWFWTSSPWVSLVASASAGGVTATATATPVLLTVDPGDGSGVVRCDGPGEVWVPGRGSGESDCAHVYTNRSTVGDPAGVFVARVSITWSVAWTATDGDGGELDPIVTSTDVPVVVQEAQAVIR
jgi:hypothetical protein